MAQPIPTVLIPALLCDEAMYRDVIAGLGNRIEASVLLSPKPRLDDSVADVLARAPATFALVGTSYGGNLAMAVALAALDRVRALWLMGCRPEAQAPGGPDLAAGLSATPEAVIDMLAGLVVHKDALRERAVFKEMAYRIGGAAGSAQARALVARADLSGRLGELRMPTLVLWGEEDRLVPVAVGHALAEALPDARFEALAGCGHLPTLEMLVAAGAAFARLLSQL